ncbi:MAG: SWIM zinc finger family protein [Candidatus Promineofilum sp.]|nr:SWIM zinc finger family protein [Promineifilum sp.]
MKADSLHILALEQIAGMAPDHATWRVADELARGEKWGATGWSRPASPNGRVLWAEFPENRRPDIHTTLALPAMAATCNCAATRFPCRHIIALLLKDRDQSVDYALPPDWVAMADGPRRADGPAAEPAADSRHRAALAAGMADLQLWLNDLAHQGLAGLPKRDRRFWAGAADRLVDAYGFEAAREVRELATIPGSAPDWPERLLPRLGRLALLCAAFQRLDELSPGEEGDALAAAGRPPRPGDDRVRDQWLVLGRRQIYENKQRRERLWLRGVDSGRWALLVDSRPAARLEGLCLPTGATFDGELAYTPSAWPLQARPIGDLRLIPPTAVDPTAGGTAIDGALAGYAAALADNPWLRHVPLILEAVFLEPPAPGRPDWRLRDRSGRLMALPPRFAHGWRLLALAADRPLTFFGEWDGELFTPLSVYQDGWLSMAGWRGLP